jgi:hypothetical protein
MSRNLVDLNNKVIDLIKKPTSYEDITNILMTKNIKSKFVPSTKLYNFNTLEELLSPHDCILILYLSKPDFGHWCCMFKHSASQSNKQNYIEFFDSYGVLPDGELKYISLDFKKEHHMIHANIKRLITASPLFKLGDINYNNYHLQSTNNTVATCGRHCTIRLINKNIDINEYKDLLDYYKSDNQNFDYIVTLIWIIYSENL